MKIWMKNIPGRETHRCRKPEGGVEGQYDESKVKKGRVV